MSTEKPWDVMRRTAWASLCAAINLPDTADEATRKTISDAALAYARASGMKWDTKADGTAPRRQATGERSAVAGDGFTFRFGSCKGKGLGEVDVKDLRFYERCAVASLDNPEKERFRANNQRDLDAIRGELRRRGEAADY